MFNDSRRGKSSNFQLVKQAFSPVAGPLTLKRGVEGVLEWSRRELASKLDCEIHTHRDGMKRRISSSRGSKAIFCAVLAAERCARLKILFSQG